MIERFIVDTIAINVTATDIIPEREERMQLLLTSLDRREKRSVVEA